MTFLSGYKTYIFAAIAAIAVFLNMLGIIDDETLKIVLGFVGAGGIAALRAGVKKVEQ